MRFVRKSRLNPGEGGSNMRGLLFLIGLVGHPIWATAAPDPQHVNAILCETEVEAISLAIKEAAAQSEIMAMEAVNKAAGKQVCGRYVGSAVPEEQKTENYKGGLYEVASLRFVEDSRLAWTASWITPFNGGSLQRGAMDIPISARSPSGCCRQRDECNEPGAISPQGNPRKPHACVKKWFYALS